MSVKREQGQGPASRQGTVQSVERALDLLEAIAAEGGEVAAGRLVELTGLAPATAYRLLRVLDRRGYARHSPATRSYALGPLALLLGEEARRMLGSWAEPALNRLASATGETANLAVLESNGVIYVAQVPSPQHRVRMFTAVGRISPLHSTAVGKALLAFSDLEQARERVRQAGLERRTAHTITDLDEFMEVLERVRVDGYALDDEEEEDGVRCIAMPVLVDGQARAAVSVSAPLGRLVDAQVAETVRTIEATTGELAALLAGHETATL